MQHLQINPTKNSTIHLLLHKQFPAIKSSDDQLSDPQDDVAAQAAAAEVAAGNMPPPVARHSRWQQQIPTLLPRQETWKRAWAGRVG